MVKEKKKVMKKIKEVKVKETPIKKVPIREAPKLKNNKVIIDKKIHSPKNIMRLKSGIPGLDPLIQEGFEKNSINLLTGASGSGKTVFGVQFLLQGIKDGENCLYVTFEEQKTAFYRNMYELGFDLEKLEQEGKFHFLEYTPQKVKTMLEEGGGAIETLVLTKKISRMVIDSMTSFMLLFERELEKKEAALSLFNLIKGWECTSLIIIEEDPAKGPTSSAILDLEADSSMLLYFSEAKGTEERKRYFEVVKMRGTNHSLKKHEIHMGKNGIHIKE